MDVALFSLAVSISAVSLVKDLYCLPTTLTTQCGGVSGIVDRPNCLNAGPFVERKLEVFLWPFLAAHRREIAECVSRASLRQSSPSNNTMHSDSFLRKAVRGGRALL
jgi:hypothetical protein